MFAQKRINMTKNSSVKNKRMYCDLFSVKYGIQRCNRLGGVTQLRKIPSGTETIIVCPANLHKSKPNIYDKIDGSLTSKIYKEYQYGIGTHVEIISNRDGGYYKVKIVSSGEEGWMKAKALEGEDDNISVDGYNEFSIYCDAIRDIYDSTLLVLNDRTKSYWNQTLLQFAKEASLTIGGFFLPPGLGTALGLILPKSKKENALERAHKFKAKNQNVLISYYNKGDKILNPKHDTERAIKEVWGGMTKEIEKVTEGGSKNAEITLSIFNRFKSEVVMMIDAIVDKEK
ncbi:hypothetical protein ACOMICROBIO_LMKGKHOH_04020 [Vibrio sp. B1FIG11]|uniref:hypothetical protein n=1 Tax=Vibrio sp. B1FIG11 TaxID=2751177 RepID=UPI001AF437DE|nr:hypothetical protein [Vibrio sp. B1FIG11]CAD7827204.1 hypothetical protein ACOMICROBIO_LMKGKHOH_04020 [Vibrio sp. B1FIG11]CAE6963107.1 hypothetical protein ACOMICROBIO_LMKGKHOH_04020 [Vibrio sp. B1FIG11]